MEVMDFELTEEQKMIQKTARKLAQEVLLERAKEFDRREEFPRQNFTELAEVGFMGILVPEEFGGAELGDLELVLALEEIARACPSTAVTMSVHNSLVCRVINWFGTEEQKKRYLPRLASGEIIGAYAVTEPDIGSDAANIRTSATRRGDTYILNGTKAWITTGANAGCIIVFARTRKDAEKPHRGISAFIVEPTFKGFKPGKQEKKMGLRASDTCQLIFEDCEVPAENLLGKENEGFKIMMRGLDGGRIGIAAQSVGIAQACLDLAAEYAKVRKQFGKFLYEFEMIQQKFADMAARINAARLLTYYAAWLKDKNLPHSQQASMAKLFASETAVYCATEAVQIYGGYGYTKDFDVERYFRDAKVTEIYEGTNEIQRIVIARHVLGLIPPR
mgnify:FL=1